MSASVKITLKHLLTQFIHYCRTEWRDLLMMISSDSDLKKLKSLAVTGDLKVSKFRSIIWNVLLGSLSHQPDSWKDERAKQRSKYQEIKEKYILNPDKLKVAEACDNPLSQSKDRSAAISIYFPPHIQVIFPILAFGISTFATLNCEI